MFLGGLCKQHDLLHRKQIAKVKKALEKGEISTKCGLNHEIGHK